MKSPHGTKKHLINAIRLGFTSLWAILLSGPRRSISQAQKGTAASPLFSCPLREV